MGAGVGAPRAGAPELSLCLWPLKVLPCQLGCVMGLDVSRPSLFYTVSPRSEISLYHGCFFIT